MKRIASFSLLALLLLSCTKEPSKEKGEFTGPVATLDATKITQTSAILNGEVDPSELVQGAKIGFFLSTNENPSHENSSRQFKVKLDKDSKFYYEVKGLEFGTQYFSRLSSRPTAHIAREMSGVSQRLISNLRQLTWV